MTPTLSLPTRSLVLHTGVELAVHEALADAVAPPSGARSGVDPTLLPWWPRHAPHAVACSAAYIDLIDIDWPVYVYIYLYI